jgi:hypothetical protein
MSAMGLVHSGRGKDNCKQNAQAFPFVSLNYMLDTKSRESMIISIWNTFYGVKDSILDYTITLIFIHRGSTSDSHRGVFIVALVYYESKGM